MTKLKKKFRSIKKMPTWIFWMPASLLKLVKIFFWRTRIVDPNNYIKDARGYVTVTWHNRLLSFPVMFPAATRRWTKAVVSASRDGQYITDLISHFGIGSVRGSSSRRGANAQRGAMKALKAGYNVSFTPDGPRGPKYKLSRGAVHLASISGRAIIPISINVSRYWQVRSWDNFQIPKPFARVTLILGDAIEVPPSLSADELEKWRQIVEEKLMVITED